MQERSSNKKKYQLVNLKDQNSIDPVPIFGDHK